MKSTCLPSKGDVDPLPLLFTRMFSLLSLYIDVFEPDRTLPLSVLCSSFSVHVRDREIHLWVTAIIWYSCVVSQQTVIGYIMWDDIPCHLHNSISPILLCDPLFDSFFQSTFFIPHWNIPGDPGPLILDAATLWSDALLSILDLTSELSRSVMKLRTAGMLCEASRPFGERGDRGCRGAKVLFALLIEIPFSLSFRYFFTLLSLEELEPEHRDVSEIPANNTKCHQMRMQR